MKVSARNVFKGQVSQVQHGAVNAEVVLTLPGGEQLAGGSKVFSIVTRDAVDELGLKPGVSATAFVVEKGYCAKAPAG
ncbi:TOBE domain-containing protein [Pseudomonas sp. SDO5561_S422]